MKRSPAGIRAQLGHPVIDGDGHWLEPIPVFLEYLRDVGGPSAVDEMRALWRRNDEWYRSDWRERQHKRLRRTIWWGVTSQHARQGDRAAARAAERAAARAGHRFRHHLPELRPHDQRHRRGRAAAAHAARAYNRMTADMFAPYREPLRARRRSSLRAPRSRRSRSWNTRSVSCGYKAIMLRGNQERVIPAAAEGIDPRKAAWYCDNIALDSPYDYEPFWQRCVELGVAVTQHSGQPALVRIAPRSATSPTTTSATSPSRIMPSRAAFSWAASCAAIRVSISASWKAG